MAGVKERTQYGGESDDQTTVAETSCNETAGSDREVLVQPSKVEEMLQTRLDGKAAGYSGRDPFPAKGSFFGSFVTSCFYPVFKMWGGQKTSPIVSQPVDEWEIAFSDIKEEFFVGSGSQGAVFVCLYRGQQLAIKKVKEEDQTNICHLRYLKHPNIVSFIGVCSRPPCYCIVMEYCPEGTLYDFISSGEEILPAKVLHWARQIGKGMHYLHTNKIIHRDLKSLNILIAENDSLKISDFGTSRAIGDKSTRMTFAGTAAWMAPELIRRQPCSNRVDVWSYGVLLWELLTQERPYNNIGAAAIIYGVGSGKLRLPIPTQCPEELKNLLQLCWHSRPRNRPSFKQILLQLDIVAGGFLSLTPESYIETQVKWREEIEVQFKQMRVEASALPELDDEVQAAKRRDEELRHAKDVRIYYEQKLQRTHRLYRRLSAKERDLVIREQDLKRREKVCKKRHPSSGPAPDVSDSTDDSVDDSVTVPRRVKPQKRHSHASCTGPGFCDKASSNATLARKESFLPVTTVNLHTQDGSSDLDLVTGCTLEERDLDITIAPRGHSPLGAGKEAKPRGSPPKSVRKRSEPPRGAWGSNINFPVPPSDSQNDNSTNSPHSPSNSYTSSLKMPTMTSSLKMPTMAHFSSDEMGPKGLIPPPSPANPPTLLRTDSYTETASCSNDADGESDGGEGRRERGGRTWSAESTSTGLSSSSPDPDHDHTLFSRGSSPSETLHLHVNKLLLDSLGIGQEGFNFETETRTHQVPRPTILADSYSPTEEEAMCNASSPGLQHTPMGPTSIVRQYFENVSHKTITSSGSTAQKHFETSHNSSSTELEDSGFQSPRGAIV